MSASPRSIAQHLLPLLISGGALIYVFGYAIDWQAIPEATDRANMPLFIGVTVLDKIIFFLVWAFVQASMVRRFLAPVPTRQIIAVKGGAELVRALNNSISDAAFFLGVWQLCNVPLRSVVAVTTLPFAAHFLVLLFQGTFALAFVPPSMAKFSAILGPVLFGWSAVLAFLIARRLGAVDRFYRLFRLEWIANRVSIRDLLPYIGIFACFAAVDVLIQGLASRAFGNHIDWIAMVGGIPVLYFWMMLPSFANFGTREIVWANLFQGYAESASLYAFALWTNVVFLIMHVLIGVVFLNRALSLLADLRNRRRAAGEVRGPLLRDAMDP